jgi:hypothetical protein
LAQAIRRLGETGQVDRLHPHLFRHTFRVKRCPNTASCCQCRFYQTSPNQTMTQIIALHPEQSFRRRPGTRLRKSLCVGTKAKDACATPILRGIPTDLACFV